MKTYKIKCYSNKEANKLYEMLYLLKQTGYIRNGFIELKDRIVIFKIW